MATMTGAVGRNATAARWTDVTWIGTAPIVLSVALAAVAAAASATALLFRDQLRGPEVTIGSVQGTAAVLLAVTVPLLVLSMALVERGHLAWIIGWLGALGSIAYQSVLFLFGTPFNAFFFLYVAMLSLSVWALIALGGRLPVSSVAQRVGANAPTRFVAGYLLVNVALFLLLWLQATVPAVLSTDPPAFLAGTGMTTGPVQVIDLAFTLPLMALAAWLLFQRRPWGYILTGSLLVLLAIESASIGVDQWMAHAADPASTVASDAMTPVFAVLTVIGLAVLALFLRPGARATTRSRDD